MNLYPRSLACIHSVLLTTIALFSGIASAQTAASFPSREAVKQTLLRQSLHFEATGDGGMASRGPDRKLRIDNGGAVTFSGHGGDAVSVLLDGADSQARPVGRDVLAGQSNYLLGNNPANWRTAVSQFARVRVPAVYPGVDLVYYGNGEHLEHDYLLAAHADPGAIRMKFRGASARLDTRTGDLILRQTKNFEDAVRLQRPVAYQLSEDGTRQNVAAGYRLRADGEAQFTLGDYDHARPLVIDPVIVYGSYFGGKYNDSLVDLKVGSDDSLYLLLTTDSTDLKTMGAPANACIGKCGPANPDLGSSAAQDMYLLKLDPTAQTPIFATYLGGSGNDQAYNLALDTDGSIYVAGVTSSTDFPIVGGYPGGAPIAGGRPAGTLTKFSADGSMIQYSTFIGYGQPSANYAPPVMVTANHGIVYLIGQSGAANAQFIWEKNPLFKLGVDFLAKLDTTKTGTDSIVYATCIGDGVDPTTSAQLSSLALNSKGDVWLFGETNDSTFPTTMASALEPNCRSNPCVAAFLMEIDPSGTSIPYATYLGGTSSGGGTFLYARDIVIDSSDNIYVSGYTSQGDFPTPQGAYQAIDGSQAGFVSKLSPDGKSLPYSTFLGTSVEIGASAAGQLAFAGIGGTAFPVKNGLPATPPASNSYDAVFGLLDTTQSGDNSLLISSFSGLAGEYTLPTRISIASSGQLLMAGKTTATDLKVPNGYQSTPGGGTYDGFLTIVQPAIVNPTSLTFQSTAVGATSATMSATFTNGTTQMVYLQENLSDSNDFTSISTCGIVQAGKTCTINFTFTPKTSGTLTATYSLAPIGNPSAAVQIALTGIGTGGATATLSPGTLDFGNVPVGSPKSSSVMLTNSGNVALAITSATVSGAGFTLAQNQCGTSLAANSSCQFLIIANPTGAGPLTGTLTVIDAISTQTVPLTATGTAAVSDSLSPNPLVLGPVPQSQTGSGTIYFTNSGTQPLTIQNTITPQVFTVSSTTCNGPVPAQKMCTFNIKFFPNGLGPVTGTFTVLDGASNPSVTVTATGVADPVGTVTLLPNLLTFANVPPGQTTGYQITTLTNGSNTPLTFTFSQITIAGPDAASFQKAVNSCDPGSGCNPVYGASDATFTVSPGGTFQLGVRMLNDAQDLKTYMAAVSIHWNYVGASTSSTLTTTLTGNTSTPAAPSVTPTNITFPITANGQTSAAQTVIISNGGETPFSFISAITTGPNPDAFKVSGSCPKPFNKGDTCTLSLTFTPGTTGTAFTANLDVKLSTGDVNVALSGNTTTSDFTVTSPTNSAQSNPGASWTIDVAPLMASIGWNQPVTLTATGLEAYGKATFTPATVTPGNVTAISTLTLAPLMASMQRPRWNSRQNWPVLACFALCFPFAWRFKSIRSRRLLLVLLCLVAGGALSGCGDQQPVVTFTVTATSGSITHTINLTYQP